MPQTGASLSRLENGKQHYSQRVLEALGAVYNTEPWELIGRSPSNVIESSLDGAYIAKADYSPFNHLKAWREFRRMTQDDLAQRLRTTKGVVSLLESGKRACPANGCGAWASRAVTEGHGASWPACLWRGAVSG